MYSGGEPQRAAEGKNCGIKIFHISAHTVPYFLYKSLKKDDV